MSACARFGVELAVPLHVTAEADRNAVPEHLGDPAERVTRFRRGLHRCDHGLLGRRVEAADVAPVHPLQVARPGPRAVRPGRRFAQRHDVAHDRHPEMRQQQFGQGPGGHPCRGLPGRSVLEHVARHPRSRTSASPAGRRGRDGVGSAPSKARPARATSPRSTSATRCSRSQSPPASPGCDRDGCRRQG